MRLKFLSAYKVYLIGIIDDHSRYMVGWGLFRQQTSASVMEVVKGAIGQWGAPREILSDNGRQFAAWRGETKYLALSLRICATEAFRLKHRKCFSDIANELFGRHNLNITAIQ